MALLRLAALGAPEVFYGDRRLTFPLRKAQALLFYLAVEGGMHSRSKLAAFFWPDSESPHARHALRNVIALLHRQLADDDTAHSPDSYLFSSQDLLGLDAQVTFELDLEVVQHAYQQARPYDTSPPEKQYAPLIALVEHALSLIRGPFLDGFWLGEDDPFNEWVQQQQQHWQMQEHLLLDRLSSWYEVAGELEQAQAALIHWLALEPLQEEAYRRLMRVQLALGDAATAWQVYVTCRTRLSEALQIEPSAETVSLAEHIRATAADPSANQSARPTKVQSLPPNALVAPLIGRTTAFRQLVTGFQQAQSGQPQAVLVSGEAGIGKTRLTHEFVVWAQAQGAEVLSGQAFEMGGHLPYQPLIDAFRPRLEEENAPEDLLDDLWLSELSRLLPELRVRYPDLSAPTQDELTAKPRLFEAVALLLNALGKSRTLVLLLDDLQWMDEASLDLLHYLARYWMRHNCQLLLLGTVRSEGLELNVELVTALADLERDLAIHRVTLQPLSQTETMQLLRTVVGVREQGTALLSAPEGSFSSDVERPLVVLGDFLFAQTGGQPLYLLETLKLLWERAWLVSRLGTDGVYRLEPTLDIAKIVAQEQLQHELLPPSVRAMITTRLSKLAPSTRQLVRASAALGNQSPAMRLWQVAELDIHAGLEALEEAVSIGMLCEEEAGRGHPTTYRFSHDLIRDAVYTELSATRRQILHQRSLAVLREEGAKAAELAVHAIFAGDVEAAYHFSIQAGIEAVEIFAVVDAIKHYEQARALFQESKLIQHKFTILEIELLYTHLGQAYGFQNAWEKAQEMYEELLDYAQYHRQLALACMTFNRLAILAVQRANDKPKALELLRLAEQMAQTSQDQKALAETEWNRAQIITASWLDPIRALPHGQQALSLARAIHDRELEARSLTSLGWIQLGAGDFQEATHTLDEALALYATLDSESTVSPELLVADPLFMPQTMSFSPLPAFLIGAPLTQPLMNRALEAMCWSLLANAQVNIGQVNDSICSGRRALMLSQEVKNIWVYINSVYNLTFSLLEVGAYEEALGLIQPILAQARILPLTFIYQRFLMTLGNTYHALQQWEEARCVFEEADAIAKSLDLGQFRALTLSRLCMHFALIGEWSRAYRYAVQAIDMRKSCASGLVILDLFRQYEIEALLHGGDEHLARVTVCQFGEYLGSNRRHRISYLQSLAMLSMWDGNNKQAIDHLSGAVELAMDLGLPGEQWEIRALLGQLYEAEGEFVQARVTYAEATMVIQRLAESITDEVLRTRFLAGPQIQSVLRMSQ